MTVKDLTVKVTYRVGLGDVEMPQEVYDQINEAYLVFHCQLLLLVDESKPYQGVQGRT